MGARIGIVIFFLFWLAISGTCTYLFTIGIHKEVQNGGSPWMYTILLFPLSFVLIGIWGMVMSLSPAGDGTGIRDRFQQRSKTELSKGVGIGGVLFGLPFFLAGLGIMIFLSVVPVVKSVMAMNWERIPATVTESRMKTHHDSDGNTYKAIVKFRYRYQGREYESDKYDFVSFVSTSDRKGVQRKLDSAPMGSDQTAYVNPRNPAEAVLSVRLSWFYLFAFLFGGVFAGVGGGIIFAVTTGYRPGKFRNRSAVQRQISTGPVVLKSRYGGPVLKFVGILIFTGIWCGVVYFLFRQDAPTMFKVIFGFFGVLLVLGTGHAFLGLFNPRVRLEIENKYIPVGGHASLNWALSGNSNAIEEFSIDLVGQEEATYRRGTSSYTDREVFCELNLVSQGDGAQTGRGNVTVKIPQRTMYSWKAPNNKILWLIKVKGVIAKWPDIKEEYEIEVVPN